MKDSVIRERGGAIEAAPGHQQAPGRSGIVAAVAQEEGVPQHGLVLDAARHPGAGGGGLERQAAPPHPSEGRIGAYPGIERGQGGAGLECGLGVGDRRIEPRPARQGRPWKCLCGGLLRGASHEQS